MAAIILFDGDCNFCSSSVQFIIKRDKQGYFRFASLQGDVGRNLLQTYKINNQIDSIVLIEDENFYLKSTAALRISRRLHKGWKLLSVLQFIPVPLRDFFYDWFAGNRYKWFGKKESCMLPTKEVKERFLD